MGAHGDGIDQLHEFGSEAIELSKPCKIEVSKNEFISYL